MKLNRLGVHDGKPRLQGHRQAVSGVLAAIGGYFEYLAAAAGGNNRGPGKHAHEFALIFHKDNSTHTTLIFEDQFGDQGFT